MAEKLFYALLTGIMLGVFYDILRFFRLVFKRHLLLDLFFWCVSAFVVFCYLLIFNGGAVRSVYFIAVFTGFCFYIFTLGYATKGIEEKTAKKVNFQLKKMKNRLKCFKKVLQNIRVLYYNVKAKFCKRNRKDAETVGDRNE